MHRLLELENYFCNNAYEIGKVIYHYDEISSTQEIAKEIAPSAINGTCIIADKQTKGKGRLGRIWHSPPGGLWLSIIIKDIEEPLYLNPILAISCLQTIEQFFQLQPKIYWPNDIYIETQKSEVKSQNSEFRDEIPKSEKQMKQVERQKNTFKKVAGILTEGLHFDSSIYIGGIGINVNIDEKYFIENGLKEATSLYIETGRKESIPNILQDFLIKFNFLYELVQMASTAFIDETFKKHNDLLSQHVRIRQGGTDFTGQIIDVSIKEGILLKLQNNIVINFYPETIENIRRVEFAESL